MDKELVRFERKFQKNSVSGCWNWLGCISCAQPRGKKKRKKWPYGLFTAKVDGKSKLVMAHRYSYTRYVGAIESGLQIDHLCRNTLCVNPAHLEPVTPKENIRRGYALKQLVTHCKRGHEYTAPNTYWKTRPGGTRTRECRTCRKIQLDKHYRLKTD